jgi:pyruvate-formate lyase-activating enzyme
MAIRPSGQIYPCCVYKSMNNDLPSSLNTSHEDPFNHPYMVELREKMLRDEYIPNCETCYRDEKVTGRSMRTHMAEIGDNFGLPEPDDPILGVEPLLTNIDMTFSNACNNSCRMCGPELSTHWYSDAKKLGYAIPRGVVAKNNIIENDYDLTSLRYVKILGGEPLLEPQKLKNFLRKCNREQLGILFVTNCTLLPDEEIVQLLNECKDVKMNLSIDAYGPLNDFLRKGSQWETVDYNIRWFNERFRTSVHSVTSIYGVNKIHEIIDYVNSINEHIFHNGVIINGPPFMQPRHLPDPVKQHLQNYADVCIVRYPNNTKVFKLLKHELNQQGDFNEFLMYDEQLNKLRNEHWRDKNPELWNMVKEHIND